MGDEVVLDFEGFVDGVAFEGGKGEQYPLLLGSGYFIPGFEEQVAGAAVGEERDVSVTFPTEYVPELAGKDAVFRIKVHQITRRSLPEWNDDFARQQGFADVPALRRAVMETAVQKKQAQAAEQFANELIRQVTSAMTVTIPDAMVENQLDGLIKRAARPSARRRACRWSNIPRPAAPPWSSCAITPASRPPPPPATSWP